MLIDPFLSTLAPTLPAVEKKRQETPVWATKPVLGFSTWSTQILDDVPGYGGKVESPWYFCLFTLILSEQALADPQNDAVCMFQV